MNMNSLSNQLERKVWKVQDQIYASQQPMRYVARCYANTYSCNEQAFDYMNHFGICLFLYPKCKTIEISCQKRTNFFFHVCVCLFSTAEILANMLCSVFILYISAFASKWMQCLGSFIATFNLILFNAVRWSFWFGRFRLVLFCSAPLCAVLFVISPCHWWIQEA